MKWKLKLITSEECLENLMSLNGSIEADLET